LTVHAQTIHPVQLLQTSLRAPSSSSRQPLSRKARITLSWSSAGLPSGIRITLERSSTPEPARRTTVLLRTASTTGSYTVPVGKLAAGRNDFTLVALESGVPFEQVSFRGSAWRAKTKRPKKRSGDRLAHAATFALLRSDARH
jgi:hypothetical protein